MQLRTDKCVVCVGCPATCISMRVYVYVGIYVCGRGIRLHHVYVVIFINEAIIFSSLCYTHPPEAASTHSSCANRSGKISSLSALATAACCISVNAVSAKSCPVRGDLDIAFLYHLRTCVIWKAQSQKDRYSSLSY